jgi:hypothetical protein
MASTKHRWAIPRLARNVTYGLLARSCWNPEQFIPASKQGRVLHGWHVSLISTFCIVKFYLYTSECLFHSLSLTHGVEAFLRSRQLCSYSRTSQHFMEPDGSLPCSQELNPIHTTPSYLSKIRMFIYIKYRKYVLLGMYKQKIWTLHEFSWT